jgi:hypothetical protein
MMFEHLDKTLPDDTSGAENSNQSFAVHD